MKLKDTSYYDYVDNYIINNKRFNDYFKVIKNNEYIENMYKRLAKLDIDNLKNNEEYNTIIELIKDLKTKNNKILKNYPYSDDEIENFMDIIDSINFNNDYYYDYLYVLNNKNIIKSKRFINHINILDISNYNQDKNDLLSNYSIDFEGTKYQANELLSSLEMDGHYEIANQFSNSIDKSLNEDYQDNLINKKNTYTIIALQNFTMLDYLNDEIKNTDNINIKKRLIESKYNLICWSKILEDSFLKNQNNYSKTHFYQNKFKKEINLNDYLYQEIDERYKEYVHLLINYIINRKKEKYNNINDEYLDLLRKIVIKTFSSLIVSEYNNYSLNKIKVEAIKSTDSILNKKLIYSSTNLNEELVLSRKL